LTAVSSIPAGTKSSAARRHLLATALLILVATFAIRIWGISSRFLLLGDQIRDWEIALRPLTDLPLVGPPTHVHGYTIGPAFYWILWAIRVTVGPWFENLPHAGGIGQAFLQSAADALLLVAIWRRLGSMWIALAVVILEATAPFDLSLSATIWNPTMGAMLAKAATALTLLEWHKGSAVKAAVVFAVAFMAVHAYTGAVYVMVAVFAAGLLDPFIAGDRKLALRNALAIAGVILVLQLPYVAYRAAHPNEPAMSAVTGSLADVLSGRGSLRLRESIDGYVNAVNGIVIEPWHVPFAGWLLVASGVIVLLRYWRDATLVVITLVPAVMAVAGYAFFLSGLDNYYYLSLMPTAVLMVGLAVTAWPSARVSRGIAVAMVALSVAIIPWRWRYAMTINQMPEYGAIVHASQVMVGRGTALRAIRSDFALPPTNDPEFVYRILGGRLDPASPWVATIQRNGDVLYRNLSAS
jgi:hypothetical protein